MGGARLGLRFKLRIDFPDGVERSWRSAGIAEQLSPLDLKLQSATSIGSMMLLVAEITI